MQQPRDLVRGTVTLLFSTRDGKLPTASEPPVRPRGFSVPDLALPADLIHIIQNVCRSIKTPMLAASLPIQCHDISLSTRETVDSSLRS